MTTLTKLPLILALLFTMQIFIFGAAKQEDVEPSLPELLVENEWFEAGSLWQILRTTSPNSQKNTRRIGIADQSWMKTKDGVVASHSVRVIDAALLSEFDQNVDGRIDLVHVHLTDGRWIEISDSDKDGEFDKVKLLNSPKPAGRQ